VRDDPDLLRRLRDEVLPECAALGERLYLNRARDLAGRVARLAGEHDEPSLRAWAAALSDRIENYDTAGIGGLLAGLAGLVPGGARETPGMGG
jgi:hypothetical protein